MEKKPFSEAALKTGAQITPQRVGQHEGSIDEGVQPAPTDGEHDPRLKKIWVYTDNVFTPQSATDYRIVRVQTPAFDLSGWIDFTRGLPADQFQVEVRVTMAHASNVLVQNNVLGPYLAKFKDLTGQDTIVGNHVEFTIRQTHSQDNFATKIPIAYQFVVESQ